MGRRDLYAITVTTTKFRDGVEFALHSAVAEARTNTVEDVDALAAFGNPSPHEIDQAAAHAAGLLARIGMLILRPQSSDLGDPPPPHIDLVNYQMRTTADPTWGPALSITVAPKHRKAWAEWLQGCLGDVAVVTPRCEHSYPRWHRGADFELVCPQCRAAEQAQAAAVDVAPVKRPLSLVPKAVSE
jgi:hypothetical protein